MVFKGGTALDLILKLLLMFPLQVAFIIPFRNRFEQLSIFLRHMHPLLKKQKLDYRIFVVEQVNIRTIHYMK